MAAAAVSLSVSCVRDDGGNQPAREYVRVGMTVPAFSVSGEGGRTFNSPEGFAGRTTLLLFFATWCPDCQAELPVIDAVWQTVAGEPGYDVVAISRGGAEGRYEQSPDILSRYWKDHDLRMPWYLDGDRSVFDPSLINISEPTRLRRISYAVFCLKKKNCNGQKHVLAIRV